MSYSVLIDISQLRIGMYIQLDVGWMHHPFPVSSFRVASLEQIEALRALNLAQVRYFPAKSDPVVAEGAGEPDLAHESAVVADTSVQALRQTFELQCQELQTCERSFGEATRSYQQISQAVAQQPDLARDLTAALIGSCVDELFSHGDSVIRLLSEDVGVRSAQHPVNVMVLCLLLGRALALPGQALRELGTAALLHDLGTQALPLHVSEPYAHLSAGDLQRYRSHVGESVALAERMRLPVSVVTAIAQHHERTDGSGFPLSLLGEDLGQHGQILALVNHYDRLCNPSHGGEALTPHEALSVMFAQCQSKFDPVLLGAFIRMMGVYPPGSVVQLVNDGYAIVVSVNSSRPLRPRIVLHDPQVPKEHALVLDLERAPELAIRRSQRPAQLPRAVLDYLSPRKRVCYFFERAVGLGATEVGA